MSHAIANDGGDHSRSTNAPMPPAGVARQFAHGGNGSTSMAQPAPAEPLAQLDGPTLTTTDSLVMLQLASFEGRAL